MTIEDLLDRIKNYSSQDKDLVIRAFAFAHKVHKNMYRKSGEPYIIHPLSVALILAEMHADADTISAGLLHDCVEDGENISLALISETFNPTIANLVDGVTKMKTIEFDNDKEKTELANNRKFAESITTDIRILVIKLADRLHNMRTLEFQSPAKQIEHATETMEMYVPFAELIGEYTIKCELENLSFQYLMPNEYAYIDEVKELVTKEYRPLLDELICTIGRMLNSENIDFNIKVNLKPHYALYEKLQAHKTIDNVHDLIAVKILLDTEEQCYYVRNRLSDLFPVYEEKSKDYIANPKNNLYRGLHTTIKLKDNTLVQLQFKTPKMYLINAYGLTAYWNTLNTENPANQMQKDVSSFQFFEALKELMHLNVDNVRFNKELESDILAKKIYVQTPSGKIISLPESSTPVDFAYQIHTELGNNLIAASVNGEFVPLDTKLKSRDMVKVYSDAELYGPRRDYSKMCVTSRAKRKIKELRQQPYIVKKV